MSPDARAFAGVVVRSLRRARIAAVGEAVIWGAAAAAVSPILAAIAAAVVALIRLRRASSAAIVRTLEHVDPGARNLFVTADEIARGQLAASESARARVFAGASSRAEAVDIRRVVPLKPIAVAAAVAVFAWTVAITTKGKPAQVAAQWLAPAAQSSAKSPATMSVAVAVLPPSHTGLPETKATDPVEIRAVEGSVATLTINAKAARVTVEHDGAATTLTPATDGHFADRVPLTKTGYIAIATDAGERRTMAIVVAPDALPSVRLTTPGRDLVFADAGASIAFAAKATDDFGLRSLSLRYTKVSGSGEEYEFVEGEIPLAIARATTRDWTGTATRTLGELGLHEGDMLVYRAAASDARPGDGSSESDAFFIEISRLGVAAGDGFTLPEQETRYALSQQMLILKTDRLARQRGTLTPAQFGEASQNLAVEQRMIRAEFVFMLGGEIEDEEVEAERSVELQAGRLANRGQSDLRAATIAMSQAEKLLTAINPADALVEERKAVAALQRAFARDRYILRASPTRVELDPKRRLTGDLSGAASWTRAGANTPASRRTAQLQDLLRGLADLATAPDRSRALVLAATALRIDASSEALRKAAAALQRADGVEEAIAAVAVETKRSLFAAPMPSIDAAPGLRRALTERAR